jgi:hypothetical protein
MELPITAGIRVAFLRTAAEWSSNSRREDGYLDAGLRPGILL